MTSHTTSPRTAAEAARSDFDSYTYDHARAETDTEYRDAYAAIQLDDEED